MNCNAVKLIFFYILLSSLPTLLFAQAPAPVESSGKGKITGKVIDAATKAPVDYATISIFKEGNPAPFNGTTADPKGGFVLNNIPFGEYKVTIEFVGYKAQILDHLTLSAAAPVKALGIITLGSATQLKTVTVTAKAPIVETHIDKMVYNAANDLTSQGGVAMDVLKKVPQVSVDLDGNVELQGNSNIRFLINGKPSSIFGSSLADALQTIPASQIQSIEVITSPGAKYDAEGTGGIINIILKESKVQGVNGSVNLAAGSRFENGSFNLSARKNNFGVNAFFSGNDQLNTNTLTTTQRTAPNDDLLQNGNSDFKRHGYQTGVSFQWDITKRDNLTASFNYNNFGNSSSGLTSQRENVLTNGISSDTSSNRYSGSKSSAHAADFSLAYKKTFAKEGQELDVLYNSSYGSNYSNYFQTQDYVTGNHVATGSMGSNPGKNNETDISIDYAQPLSKGVTLETGGKVTFQTFSNSVTTDNLEADGSYVFNPDQSYNFDYTRRIYAYYLSSSFSMFNDFINGKAGLRYEYTTNEIRSSDIDVPDYGVLAPSIVLNHKFDETQSIKASFTYRVQRPNYSNLNPFVNVSDPHNISYGNPDLKPEKGYNYELGYNNNFAQGTSLFISAIYRYNKNDLQPYTTYSDSVKINGTEYYNVTQTMQANIGTQTFIGGNLYASIPATKKLTFRTNVFFGERANSSPGLGYARGFGYRGNLNATYSFSKDLAAEGFVNYNSSQVTIQGNRPSFYWYNLALRKQLWNKKASIGISAANIFAKYEHQTAYTYGPKNSFTEYTTRSIPLQSIGITLSYKFGKLEFKDQDHHGDHDTDQDNQNNDNNPPAPPTQNQHPAGQGQGQTSQIKPQQ